MQDDPFETAVLAITNVVAIPLDGDNGNDYSYYHRFSMLQLIYAWQRRVFSSKVLLYLLGLSKYSSS